MTYKQFKDVVTAKGWTVRFLRSDDAPPTEELLAFMDSVGLTKYETYVLMLQQDQDRT